MKLYSVANRRTYALHGRETEGYYGRQLAVESAWLVGVNWQSSLHQFMHPANSCSITHNPLFRRSD